MPVTTPSKRTALASSVQPTITSFFTSSPRTQRPTASLAPNPADLPTNVQSGLLAVGMRVRKSVPQGYKTGTYAYNKYLPELSNSSLSVINLATATSTSPSKKRDHESVDHDAEIKIKDDGVQEAQRDVLIPKLKKPKKRVHHVAVAREAMAKAGFDMRDMEMQEFEDAGFLMPIEEVEMEE
ncbi:hypothetical protein RUND412_010523 [Rhizina undulata]